MSESAALQADPEWCSALQAVLGGRFKTGEPSVRSCVLEVLKPAVGTLVLEEHHESAMAEEWGSTHHRHIQGAGLIARSLCAAPKAWAEMAHRLNMWVLLCLTTHSNSL